MGFMKWVSTRPSSAALRFIRAAKASTDPAEWMARATAASLPLCIIRPYKRSLRLIRSPAFRYREEPSVPAARGSTSTRALRSSPDSRIKRAVMILVVLAIGSLSCSCSPISSRPLLASIRA